MGDRAAKDALYNGLAEVANTSFHLRSLAIGGLVTTRRAGTRIYYSLASPTVEALWAAVRAVAVDHHDTIDALAAAYLGKRDGIEEIDLEELAQRLEDDNLILLDVRPEPEYRAGHIRGARSIPITELADQIATLPKDAEIVAYCRGPFCVYADDAIRLLKRCGRTARRLSEGMPEWRAARLPIESVPSQDRPSP